jgi:hypothetical protein
MEVEAPVGGVLESTSEGRRVVAVLTAVAVIAGPRRPLT